MPDVVVPRPRDLDHRAARTTVTVTGTDGRPLAGTEVVVAQRRHAFVFGNIGFDLLPLANGVKSDGLKNLRRAALDRPELAPGVYIAAGDVFDAPDDIYKDFDKRVFVKR